MEIYIIGALVIVIGILVLFSPRRKFGKMFNSYKHGRKQTREEVLRKKILDKCYEILSFEEFVNDSRLKLHNDVKDILSNYGKK